MTREQAKNLWVAHALARVRSLRARSDVPPEVQMRLAWIERDTEFALNPPPVYSRERYISALESSAGVDCGCRGKSNGCASCQGVGLIGAADIRRWAEDAE